VKAIISLRQTLKVKKAKTLAVVLSIAALGVATVALRKPQVMLKLLQAYPRRADAVSLLAAIVLYLVSIGDVRGFAFTLGLSTISDLFIVFCFTKPLLAVMARTKMFDSGHGWTGVGGAERRKPLEAREA